MNKFWVPKLKDAGAWVENRVAGNGGADWRGYRNLKTVSKIAIHHTVTNPLKNLSKEMSVVWNIHKNNRWGGIGYNFLIGTEESKGYAKVAMIGDIASIRAHTPNNKGTGGIKAQYGNYYIIGISLVGLLHLNMPTNAQLRSAHELCKELIYSENTRLPALKSWNDVWSHKNFDATACSGMWDKQKPLIIKPPNAKSEPKPDPVVNECEEQVKDLTDKLHGERVKKVELIGKVEKEEERYSELLVKLNDKRKQYNNLELAHKKTKDTVKMLREAVLKLEESNWLTRFIEWLESRKGGSGVNSKS